MAAFTTTSVVGGGVTAWWEVLKHRLIKEGNVGYSEAWITRRIKTIEIRKGLTDEWKRGGVTKENLRDNMTNMELLLNSLAEEAAASPQDRAPATKTADSACYRTPRVCTLLHQSTIMQTRQVLRPQGDRSKA